MTDDYFIHCTSIDALLRADRILLWLHDSRDLGNRNKDSHITSQRLSEMCEGNEAYRGIMLSDVYAGIEDIEDEEFEGECTDFEFDELENLEKLEYIEKEDFMQRRARAFTTTRDLKENIPMMLEGWKRHKPELFDYNVKQLVERHLMRAYLNDPYFPQMARFSARN